MNATNTTSLNTTPIRMTFACGSGILAGEMVQPMPPNSRKPASPSPTPNSANEQAWNAVLARDSRHDGKFVFAVASTGVYCRPSCPARRPRRENVTFFTVPEQAESAGFRACLRCRPRLLRGNPQIQEVRAICRYIEQHLDESITLHQLGKAFQQSP